MSKEKYYGTENPTTFTFMEFGEFDTLTSMKKTWGFKMHQKAYDWFMLSRYANDILAFNTMKRMLAGPCEQSIADFQAIIDVYNLEVHHEDEMSLHLAQNIAMIVSQDKSRSASPSFYELGQTLFGCIEGMELYQDIINCLKIECPRIDYRVVDWYGVDISNMFNELSKTFHQGYKVNTMLDQKDLPEQMDVFFSKGITLLYAIRNLEDLFITIKKGKIAVFDYSFALGNPVDTTIGSGKTVRYLGLNPFLAELKNHKERLYVKKSNSRIIKETNRLWVDCIFGEQSICEDFIKLDVKLRNEIANKLSQLKGTERFLNNDVNPEWVTIEEII